jgi:glycerol-3-phosphate dehydrogenase
LKPPADVPAAPTDRAELLARLAQGGTWDLAVIGGGATGLGVALDAATRGLRVVLLESHDFAKGTSSRATKLVHGGVRYLAQGNIGLVREALHERTTLLRNAPHLAQPLPFVLPAYRLWEVPFYGTGLLMYDGLAGVAGLGRTEFLTRAGTLACLPTVRPEGLKGGIKYWDGQFDDARLALAIARTAAAHGALLLNYCGVIRLLHADGRLAGLVCQDGESGREYRVAARCIVNATGVWVDALRQQDGEATGHPVQRVVAPSQGVHAVVDRDFLPGQHALMVPKTADGRVLFCVPWLGKLVLGTTDTPRTDLPREPRPFREEIEFILRESGRYLVRAPRPQDIRSLWVGLRPLVKPMGGSDEPTKAISREHTVLVSRSGLVTVTGGKWTTYRAMAEDVLEKCFAAGLLPRAGPGRTAGLPLVGAPEAGTPPISPTPLSAAPGLHLYGAEAAQVADLPGEDRHLGVGLTAAMVRFAARHEYARTVEDVLARRFRLLFLDAALAASLAEEVAELLRQETGADPQVDAFRELAAAYLSLPA